MTLRFSAIAWAVMLGAASLGLAACADSESVFGGGPSAEKEAALNGVGSCRAGEDVIFSCQLESGDQVSVCVTGGEGEDEGISFAQFRTGSAGKSPDMVWPLKPGDGAMRWHSEAYSGGGETQIGFSDGDTQTLAYSSVVRTNFAAGEPNNPAISDGVITVVGDQITSHLRCGDDVFPVDAKLVELYAARAYDPLVASEFDGSVGE